MNHWHREQQFHSIQFRIKLDQKWEESPSTKKKKMSSEIFYLCWPKVGRDFGTWKRSISWCSYRHKPWYRMFIFHLHSLKYVVDFFTLWYHNELCKILGITRIILIKILFCYANIEFEVILWIPYFYHGNSGMVNIEKKRCGFFFHVFW